MKEKRLGNLIPGTSNFSFLEFFPKCLTKRFTMLWLESWNGEAMALLLAQISASGAPRHFAESVLGAFPWSFTFGQNSFLHQSAINELLFKANCKKFISRPWYQTLSPSLLEWFSSCLLLSWSTSYHTFFDPIFMQWEWLEINIRIVGFSETDVILSMGPPTCNPSLYRDHRTKIQRYKEILKHIFQQGAIEDNLLTKAQSKMAATDVKKILRRLHVSGYDAKKTDQQKQFQRLMTKLVHIGPFSVLTALIAQVCLLA